MKRSFVVAVALAVVASAASGAEEFTDDLIILKSDLAVEGRVIERTDRHIRVRVEYGTYTIPLAAIKRIDFNLNSRLAELADDDHAGRYRLLKEAIREGATAQVRRGLDDLVGKPGVLSELYRTLGELAEADGDRPKAHEMWQRYALANPDDKAAASKVAELADGREASGSEDASAVTEGLEVGAAWQAQSWGNPASVEVRRVDGNSILMVEVPAGGGQDKASILRTASLDLSAYDRLAFRAFGAEQTRTEVAVALITSANYYESRTITVGPDWKLDLSIDLREKNWKSAATNWAFTAQVEGLESVRQIGLLIYSGRRRALVYFDYIRPE